MTIWKVEGECAIDSGGGVETWIYVTADETSLPDVQRPFYNSRCWCRIYRITALGSYGQPAEEFKRRLLGEPIGPFPIEDVPLPFRSMVR
jgi:hypothetical protein